MRDRGHPHDRFGHGRVGGRGHDSADPGLDVQAIALGVRDLVHVRDPGHPDVALQKAAVGDEPGDAIHGQVLARQGQHEEAV